MTTQITEYEDLVTFFSKHLISMRITYKINNDNQLRSYNYSSFLMELDDDLIIVTAGHVISQIEEITKSENVSIDSMLIVDNLGTLDKNITPIPFSLMGLKYSYVDIESPRVDLGYIVLNKFFSNQIKGGPATPIKVSDCIDFRDPEIEKFFLLGFPDQIQPNIDKSDDYILINPTIIPIDRIPKEDIPEDRAHQFCGMAGDIKSIGSISGTSGGPIFALKRIDTQYRYWLCAIQSSWAPHSRTLYGTSALDFADALMAYGIKPETLKTFQRI